MHLQDSQHLGRIVQCTDFTLAAVLHVVASSTAHQVIVYKYQGYTKYVETM